MFNSDIFPNRAPLLYRGPSKAGNLDFCLSKSLRVSEKSELTNGQMDDGHLHTGVNTSRAKTRLGARTGVYWDEMDKDHGTCFGSVIFA